MRIAAFLIAALIAAPAVAKLPPLSEDAKAKAAEHEGNRGRDRGRG